jgi:gliding motility-associated-like protein
VRAGDFVTFTISATDFEYCPNSTPQTMSLYAVGKQFAAPMNPGGCLNPPCANLTPTTTLTNPITGMFGVQTSFSWQTTCDHLATNVGCGVTSNTYNFLFKTKDNFCPAPGINFSTVTIVVLTKPTLPSPHIRCVKVLGNGDVELAWHETIDTMNTFEKYYLYSSVNPNGPFTLIDSIADINILTYTHNGAGANTQQVYYYIKTKSGCPGNAQNAQPQDTVSTILLDVNNPNPANGGIAYLDWNPIRSPHLPTSSGIYHIWREFPTGNWVLIDSTTALTFQDEVTFCDEFINYRIEIADTISVDSNGVATICYSVSNVDGDQFQDITPPPIPVIDTVTVDNTTGNASIVWDANSAFDTEGYIIYMETGGVFVPIDTVWGRLDTTYTDLVNNPCNSSITYAVQSIDSCYNADNMSDPHNTIYATVSQTPCVEEVNLTWNDYINMLPGLGGYNIYVSQNGGTKTLLTTVGSTVTSYTDNNVLMDNDYCYYIEAFDDNNTKTSTSCITCIRVEMPAQPDFLYIKTATVENDDFVTVKLHTDNTVNVQEYQLFRSTDGITFTQVATLPPAATQEIIYNDYTAGFRFDSYYYQAVVVDSCGYAADTSNIARTILLNIITNQNVKTNTLTWNDYEGFDGTPSTYNIYRKIDNTLDPLPISVHPPMSGTYTDDVGAFPTSSGNFRYFVEAVEGPGNQYGLSEISLSNEVMALMEPNIYVPNVFRPASSIIENRTFKPIGVFIPLHGYTLQIFNRYGQMLWQTQDINEGWDGMYDGNEVADGVYVYLVKFTSATGELFEKRGTVTLLR